MVVSPVRPFGIHRLIRCVICPSSLNVLGGTWMSCKEMRFHWKRISLQDIRDMSALEVSLFHGIALYKSTFTYLLIYLHPIKLAYNNPVCKQSFTGPTATNNSPFLLNGDRNHRQYLLHRSTEGWPGWVGLSLSTATVSQRASEVTTLWLFTNMLLLLLLYYEWPEKYQEWHMEDQSQY